MNSPAVRTVEAASPPLGKADWISAALTSLINDGVDAVQITRLSKALNVSRGSFYWHFSDRQDLLNRMLDEWKAANSPVIEDVLDRATSLSDGVLAFFAIWEQREQFSPQLDQAVRDWARLDDNVLKIVRDEDTRRIAIISKFFVRFGYSQTESPVRARVLYFAQVGYYAMNVDDSMSSRSNMLEHYFHSFTGQVMNVEAARRFREAMGLLT